MATTMDLSKSCFSSDLPYTIFNGDLNQYSLHNLNEDNKKFLWHQFMLNVLLDIPHSLTSNEDIIEACSRLLNENDGNANTTTFYQKEFADFRANYTSDNAINWYTRSSFLFSALNKACRTLNSDAIVPFHPIIKDLTIQLKQLHKKEKEDGKLKFPFTVYRGQTNFGKDEFEKIRANVGHRISMNTFLSTSANYLVSNVFIDGFNKGIPVLFQITVKDLENKQIFACIDQNSKMKDEEEVLFGMSSVFKIVSVEDWSFLWNVELELTSCEDDQNIQRFINEIKSYLYQISGRQTPFILFKQLFTNTSLSQVRPFTEFIKYFLIDLTQLFVIHNYKKEGQLTKLIKLEPDLHELVMKRDIDNIHSNERIIYLLFDLLNQFYYYYKNENIEEKEILFEKNDYLSLFSFGGFLLLTGEYDKANEYFQILLKNNSINEKLKSSIYSILGNNYIMMKDKQSASQSFNNALKSFELSMGTYTPPWLATSIASSYITQIDSPQIPDILKPFINQEHSDNDVHEKIRLIHRGYIYSEEQKFIQALNYWEAALEITSYLPSSLITMLNGAIYVQMAGAYLRLNNLSKTLSIMEKAKTSLESYYSSKHRLFGGFYLMYGYYLIQNQRVDQSIPYLNKALENPYFSNDKEFLGIIYTLLIMAYLHQADFVNVKEYGQKAKPYISQTSISSQIPYLLKEISEIERIVHYQNADYARQFVSVGLIFGQSLLPIIFPNSTILPESIDEENITVDQLITLADHYRHREDYENAQIYYIKSLEKSKENDSKYIWNIYKKLVRMNINHQFEDYFSILYSKYDDDNIKHLQIISTLQIILYKLNLLKNEFRLSFNSLIYSIFINIKYLYYQNTIQSNYIYDLFNHFINREEIIKIIFILTELIKIYSNKSLKYLEEFILKYFSFNNLNIDLSKIIYHEQIDNILNEIKSKSFISFIHLLLKILRQKIPSTEKSTISFKDQILEFLNKYNQTNQPFFFLMKIFQSFILNDTQSFFYNLEQFRLNIFTFEKYQEFKQKLSDLFQQLDEHSIYTFLQNIPINISTE